MPPVSLENVTHAKLFAINEQVTLLKSEGVKPRMGSDLWSDNSVSLIGAVLYYIGADWSGL